MNQSFTVTATDIRRQELVSAMRWICRKRDITWLVLAPIAFFIFIFTLQGFSVAAVAFPLLLLVAMAVYFEITRANAYRTFPKDIQMVYEIDAQGWTLRIGDNSGSFSWAETAALVERKNVLLLCNTKQVSNVLPKRCLSAEQIQQIRTWYRAAQ